MPPAAPWRTVTERYLVRIGIIVCPAGVPRKIIRRDLEIVTIKERVVLRWTNSIAAVSLDVGLVPLVHRIGQVGKQMGVLSQAEIVVEAHRVEMIGPLVVVEAQDRDHIVDMTRPRELIAVAGLGLKVAVRYAIDPRVGEPLRSAP